MILKHDFVELERVENRYYLTLNCRYPHELCLYLNKRSVKRLASFFISLGKGKKKATLRLIVRSNELSFPLVIKVRYEDDMPKLCFKYRYYNYSFDSISESYNYYYLFDKKSFERFGKELLEFDKTNKALLI